MEPPEEPGTPDGLQGPESCIPSPRDKRLDGAMSTIIDASARPFPGPGLGEENDSCSHKSPSVAGGEISTQEKPRKPLALDRVMAETSPPEVQGVRYHVETAAAPISCGPE